MPKYVAAIDQGTTSTRFMIFDHDGNVAAMDQKEHRQIFPKPGWVEHDPLEVWQRTREVIQGALEKGKIAPKDIAAIGITNQRETAVVWERSTGKPVGNAIVWQDTRTDAICAELARAGGPDRLRAKTGLPLATYFSGPKIKWILDNHPEARRKAENGELLFGNMDTWILWNLTGGVHVTDVTNASRTQLMNLETLDWDDDLLRLLGIPRSMLPRICSSSEVYGLVGARSPHRGPWVTLSPAGHADRRRPGRPAGGAVRADLFPPRRGQEHLRHRLLHADEYGRTPDAQRERPSDHIGL